MQMKLLNHAIPFCELPLSDDFMFGEVMRRPEICRLFLEALLGKPIAKIEYISKQQDISDSYSSHGIRLDVYLRDEANTVYSVEMQNGGGSLLLKRIRYYQGMIDRHNLRKSEHYSKLPESFIIMICTSDLIGRGMAVYRRRDTIAGCEDYEYNDGTNVYLLNSACTTENADDAILEFLRCIRTNNTNPEDYASRLMKEVCPAMAEVRSDPGKEAEYMTWQTKMMDIEYKAKEEGRKEGREEGRVEEREIGLRTLIETLHALSQSREAIEQIVVDKFHLSPSVAKEKVAQYWS